MANPIKLLSKLLGRNPKNEFLSELYSKMAQPLFVHPQLGQLMMRSYLDGANLNFEPMKPAALREDQIGSYSVRSDNLAVIDISGALVAHEMNVPCGQSPTSYSQIKQDIQMLHDDPTVDTVIGRFDSPGGAASQNMDLSDFIYSLRGQGTRFIAQVDDMAYSAAFGIASAFDEIWVTRTSGVGSVGVVSYHVDQSEANKKAGVKVEYIYAGDKKVLGNPHEALSEEGRAEYQNEVSRLYEIFTTTVARNLGMSVEAIKATQAGTFHGEAAITAGFAHKMGTFDELLSSLVRVDSESKTMPIGMEDDSPEINAEVNLLDVESSTNADSLAATDKELTPNQATEEDVDEDKSTETVDGATPNESVDENDEKENDDVALENNLEQITQDAELALTKKHNNIRGLCVAAGVPDAAVHFISADMSVELVREQLLDLTSSPESSIVSATSVALKRDRSTIQAGWKQAFDAVKAK